MKFSLLTPLQGPNPVTNILQSTLHLKARTRRSGLERLSSGSLNSLWRKIPHFQSILVLVEAKALQTITPAHSKFLTTRSSASGMTVEFCEETGGQAPIVQLTFGPILFIIIYKGNPSCPKQSRSLCIAHHKVNR